MHDEGIALALFANGGRWAVSGNDHGFIGQRQHPIAQGGHDLFEGAPRKISASNAARKQGVAGNQLALGREVETNAAFSVAGSMHHGSGQLTGAEDIGVAQLLINLHRFWRRYPNVGSKVSQQFELRQIILVQQDGCASNAL